MHPLRAGVLNTRRRPRLATGAARYAVMCGRCDSRCVAQGGVSRPSEARRARTLNETPFFDARETLERTAPRGAPRSAQRAHQRQRKLGPCQTRTYKHARTLLQRRNARRRTQNAYAAPQCYGRWRGGCWPCCQLRSVGHCSATGEAPPARALRSKSQPRPRRTIARIYSVSRSALSGAQVRCAA